MTATATLAITPGAGLLARQPTALLFASQRDANLVEAFRSADLGEEIRAVATTVVGAGFEVGPFACVSWASDVRVMVFGDVAIETDQPSLPMLSGAGSRTWVEHSLQLTGPASLSVAGGAADEFTDLAAGIVLAGGFRLDLGRADRTSTWRHRRHRRRRRRSTPQPPCRESQWSRTRTTRTSRCRHLRRRR